MELDELKGDNPDCASCVASVADCADTCECISALLMDVPDQGPSDHSSINTAQPTSSQKGERQKDKPTTSQVCTRSKHKALATSTIRRSIRLGRKRGKSNHQDETIHRGTARTQVETKQVSSPLKQRNNSSNIAPDRGLQAKLRGRHSLQVGKKQGTSEKCDLREENEGTPEENSCKDSQVIEQLDELGHPEAQAKHIGTEVNGNGLTRPDDATTPTKPVKLEQDDSGAQLVADATRTEKGFACMKCGRKFMRHKKFTSHQCCKFNCHQCSRKFPSEFKLKRHMKSGMVCRQVSTENHCPKCDRCFSSSYGLNAHIQSHIRKGEMEKQPRKKREVKDNDALAKQPLVHTCGDCDRIFKNSTRLKIHRRIHTGEKPYQCTVCEKQFTQKGNLVAHNRIHKGERPFLCPACGKGFTQKSTLEYHARTHMDKSELEKLCLEEAANKRDAFTSRTCEDCGRVFHSREGFRYHKITHLDIKPHACSYCSARFRSKAMLREHVFRHTGVFHHQCSHCAKKFIRRRDLVRHQNYHIIQSGARPKNLTCDICANVFTSQVSLAQHKRCIHEKTRGHECDQCKKRFPRAYSLLVHMRTHTKEKPYFCAECGKRFSDPSNLKHHEDRFEHQPPNDKRRKMGRPSIYGPMTLDVKGPLKWHRINKDTSASPPRKESTSPQAQVATDKPTRPIAVKKTSRRVSASTSVAPAVHLQQQQLTDQPQSTWIDVNMCTGSAEIIQVGSDVQQAVLSTPAAATMVSETLQALQAQPQLIDVQVDNMQALADMSVAASAAAGDEEAVASEVVMLKIEDSLGDAGTVLGSLVSSEVLLDQGDDSTGPVYYMIIEEEA